MVGHPVPLRDFDAIPGRTLKQPVLGRVLEVHRGGECSFPKPGELAEVMELRPLTLNDRRIWNLLMVQAWPTITEDKEHVISKSVLRGSHDSTDRLADTIKRLMGTIVEIPVMRNGKRSVLR